MAWLRVQSTCSGDCSDIEARRRTMTFAREHLVPIPLYSESDGDNSGRRCAFTSRRVGDGRWVMCKRPIRLRVGPICRSVIARPARIACMNYRTRGEQPSLGCVRGGFERAVMLHPASRPQFYGHEQCTPRSFIYGAAARAGDYEECDRIRGQTRFLH
jgi:hypothetical protein